MAHGGPSGMLTQSPRLNSSGLYWSGTKYAPCISFASPFAPCPIASNSLHRSNPHSFQSKRSVTTTDAKLIAPCTNRQSLFKKATAVAISRIPSNKYSPPCESLPPRAISRKCVSSGVVGSVTTCSAISLPVSTSNVSFTSNTFGCLIVFNLRTPFLAISSARASLCASPLNVKTLTRSPLSRDVPPAWVHRPRDRASCGRSSRSYRNLGPVANKEPMEPNIPLIAAPGRARMSARRRDAERRAANAFVGV